MLFAGRTFSQSSEMEARTYTDSEGKLYWNKELPVYLRAATSPDEKGVLLQSEQHQQYVNPLYLDTEGVNYIRTRYAVDQGTKETVTPKVEILLEIYADGTPPRTADSFEGASEFTSGNTRFIGKNLTVGLEAKDNLSGLNQIYYSLNGKEFEPFKEPIAFDQEGEQELTFYSFDQVGNKEESQDRKFTIDLSAPITYHNINGIAEDYIISSSSTIYFTIEDRLSGVKGTYYRFDDEEFRQYEGKNLNFDYLTDGEHVL